MDLSKFVVILIYLIYSTAAGEAEGISTEVPQGALKGISENTLGGKEFYSFYGIPYAKPPVGNLRFKDPEAASPWEGVLEANTMPEYCKQISIFQQIIGKDVFVGEEDCLFLNIHLPKLKKPYSASKVPVMVFIHGGGFMCGGAKEYSARTLMEEDIILVFIQYRVGVFGFMSTEDATIPGNFGLKDQALALKWVKENIKAFGGDPGRITIFGESAGGASVHFQMLSPWTKGLFHRAIMQSGVAILPWAQDHQLRKIAEEMGQTVNCSLDGGSEHFLTCMQSADGLELLKFVQNTYIFLLAPNYMAPRVDGDFLPEAPEILLREGKYHKVDLVAGITRDEGAGFLDFMSDEEAETFDEKLTVKMFLDLEENSEDILRSIKDRYFGGKEVSIKNAEEFVKMMGDRYNIIGHQITQSFHVEDPQMNVYLYELYQNPVVSAIQTFLGHEQTQSRWVAHGTDLEFLFLGGGILQPSKELNEEDAIIRKYFVKLWSNFAKTGNPTPDDSLGGIRWPKSDGKMDFLAIKTNLEMMQNSRKKDVEWWSRLPLREFKLLGIHKPNVKIEL